MDWLGTTILPALTSLLGGGFLGWGKPVNTNPSQLRWGLRGLALVALAGPASNVIFAVLLAVLSVWMTKFSPAAALYFKYGVRLSLYLAIFNMLPVPPLDGSKLLLAAKIPYFITRAVALWVCALIVAPSVTALARGCPRGATKRPCKFFACCGPNFRRRAARRN